MKHHVTLVVEAIFSFTTVKGHSSDSDPEISLVSRLSGSCQTPQERVRSLTFSRVLDGTSNLFCQTRKNRIETNIFAIFASMVSETSLWVLKILPRKVVGCVRKSTSCRAIGPPLWLGLVENSPTHG